MNKNIKGKDIEMEMRDVLMNIFNDTPRLIEAKHLNIRNVNETDEGTSPRYNYERDQIAWANKKRIDFDGRKLAIVRMRPHKKVTVYAFYDEGRYAQKVFERVVETYLPEVKLETVDTE